MRDQGRMIELTKVMLLLQSLNTSYLQRIVIKMGKISEGKISQQYTYCGIGCEKMPDLLFLYCWALVVQVLSYESCCG